MKTILILIAIGIVGGVAANFCYEQGEYNGAKAATQACLRGEIAEATAPAKGAMK